MPVPSCLGHGCTPCQRVQAEPGRAPQALPAPPAEGKLPRAGLEGPEHAHAKASGGSLVQVLEVLAEQQAALQRVLEQQRELRGIVELGHEAQREGLREELRRLLGDLGQAASGGLEEAAKEQQRPSFNPDLCHTWALGNGGRKPHAKENGPATPLDIYRSGRVSKFLRRVMENVWFDVAMGLVIVVNMLVMCMQLQWQGYDLSYSLGLRGDNASWDVAQQWFYYLEACFCTVYLVELLVKAWLQRARLLRDPGALADAAVVLASAVDAFVFTPMQMAGTKSFLLAKLLRVMRVFKVLRTLKVLRLMDQLKDLRILLRTLRSSLASVFWSMLLVFFLIMSSAILMVQLLHGFIEDDSQDEELRRWAFLQFGDTFRATYSMFEATFTTGWAAKSRTLIDEVSPWFSLFWIPFVVLVNFAVMRVVSALFLKQTLAVANLDAERVVMEKMKEKEAFAEKIREVFAEADQLGDGVIHRFEFEDMMQNEKVLEIFDRLEMEAYEVHTLYTVLSDNDGVVDYEEFLSGAMKMKNSARTLDIVQLLHQQMILKRSMDILGDNFTKALKSFSSIVAEKTLS